MSVLLGIIKDINLYKSVDPWSANSFDHGDMLWGNLAKNHYMFGMQRNKPKGLAVSENDYIIYIYKQNSNP